MSRIAIIDTAIDTAFIGGKPVERIDLCGVADNSDGKTSHGTLCAMVLEHCTTNYELINIQIFKDNKRKVFGEIDILARALEMCREKDVDIVSLSSASSILSDTNKLYGITKELCTKTVVVSAIDNRQYVSIPASYPFVIGVQNDSANVLKPGEIALDSRKFLGANVYANCDFPLLKEHGCGPSNSFAVPVVTAFVNDKLNCGCCLDIDELLTGLKPYTGAAPPEMRQPENEVPIVFVTAGNAECKRLMDMFYNEFEVQCSALSLIGGEYDVRIKCVAEVEKAWQEIQFMQRHYKTDLIFIAGMESHLAQLQNSVEIDVVLTSQDDGHTVIEYEGMQEIEPGSRVAARLYEILTSDA